MWNVDCLPHSWWISHLQKLTKTLREVPDLAFGWKPEPPDWPYSKQPSDSIVIIFISLCHPPSKLDILFVSCAAGFCTTKGLVPSIIQSPRRMHQTIGQSSRTLWTLQLCCSVLIVESMLHAKHSWKILISFWLMQRYMVTVLFDTVLF